jgi:type III pantothenate kinase
VDPATLDLVLDVGNTRTKAALFQGDRLVRSGHIDAADTGVLKTFLGGTRPHAIVAGSVAAADATFLALLEELAPLLVVRGDTPSPVRSAYGTPLTLGVDRLANAVGAARLFPGRPVLAIDPGTCITYDLMEADGTYAGGAITPGMRMRAKAMHAYSARLPLVDPAPDPPVLGTSTAASLEAGVHHGIVAEMRGFIAAYQRADMAVILTGGDALRFSRALKSGIFAHPFLTLEGLHAILVHHRVLHGPPADGDRGAGARAGSAG